MEAAVAARFGIRAQAALEVVVDPEAAFTAVVSLAEVRDQAVELGLA